MSHWGDRSAIVVARLRQGATPAAATSELALLWRRWVQAGHVHDQQGSPFARAAVPIREFVTGSVRTPMVILLGTVGFVLLIAVANVANLLLAKRTRGRATLPSDRRSAQVADVSSGSCRRKACCWQPVVVFWAPRLRGAGFERSR